MARRALVVDDSRSARAFLTRILERYELAVDAVESAEQALEYLATARPDVIFMDHLMPGMDGFQAVQAIKNNPRTATIPIMMYTSQEGELYLSQARALGAIGVLPKQIKPADVSKALEQLKLRPEGRPEGEPIPAGGTAASGTWTQLLPEPAVHPEAMLRADSAARSQAPGRSESTTRPAASEPDGSARSGYGPERRSPDRPDLPVLPAEQRTLLEAMLAHHGRELRRFVVDNLETQADRILGDMKLLLQDSVSAPIVEPPRSVGGTLAPWLAAAGFIAAAIFGVLWWQRSGDSTALATRLDRSQQQLADTQHTLQALQLSDAKAAAAAAVRSAQGAGADPPTSMVEPVPYGEIPLGGARLESVTQLLTRLSAQGFHGVVQIRSIPGRYCMVSGAGGQAVLPNTALPYSKCEQIGNPRDDEDSAGRQSIAFANMIATMRANAKFDIQVSAGSADEVATPYPVVSDALTAGEWNRIAATNNRVELRWQPSP